MASSAQLKAALDLMKRLPPGKIEDNLADLVDLAPDLEDDLLAAVDQPLQVHRDSSGRDFLLCDYNRDGDSYRSPWTNDYVPPLADGVKPLLGLRRIEELANDVFDAYRGRYYEGGVSSVYVWDLEGSADFAACVLFHKDSADLDGHVQGTGRWDAVHVLEARTAEGVTTYKLTTTVMMTIKTSEGGDTDIAVSLTRQSDRTEAAKDDAAHVINMGRQIEDMELKIRDALVNVYIGKMREVFNNLRKYQGASAETERREIQANLAAALTARNSGNTAPQ
mmetsp:Transcript_15591/g.47626  ORF Transcript_15591/g.47626 Transcript_15591/m.47626 type:complete len:279 (+) Transcript_15591:39-875(+)